MVHTVQYVFLTWTSSSQTVTTVRAGTKAYVVTVSMAPLAMPGIYLVEGTNILWDE